MSNIKRAAIALAVIGSAFAADVALADGASASTGNGSLMLYVRRISTNTVYARGLGLTVDSLVTTSTIAGDGDTSGINSFSVPINIAADSNLSGFLGASPVLSDFQWAILGGDTTAETGFGSAGDYRFVSTTQSTLSAAQRPSEANVETVMNNLDPALQDVANGAIPGTSVDTQSTSSGGGWDPAGSPNPQAWFGANLNNVSLLGQAANLYVFGSNTSGSGRSNTYLDTLKVTLDSSGLLSTPSGSAVPLPAAVWLLGSGLLGMLGIGRRRTLAVAA
jgi:hypothetical protein